MQEKTFIMIFRLSNTNNYLVIPGNKSPKESKVEVTFAGVMLSLSFHGEPVEHFAGGPLRASFDKLRMTPYPLIFMAT
jgi:hypothetical protein